MPAFLPICAECRGPLPTPAATGRPRRWCGDRCANLAKVRRRKERGSGAWSAMGEIAGTIPPDPATQRMRAAIALARRMEGDAPAPAHDQLTAAIVECQSLSFQLRSCARDLPEALRARAETLAIAIHDALHNTFGEVL